MKVYRHIKGNLAYGDPTDPRIAYEFNHETFEAETAEQVLAGRPFLESYLKSEGPFELVGEYLDGEFIPC